jgi:rSAM/selenodomain-associated transferase 1
MRSVIILFAKAPVPGCVKTRLEARLGPEQAAELHSAFVQDMLEMLESLTEAADIELHTNIETDAWREAKVSRALQSGSDLGSRMFHALEEALRHGRPKAMIVGSDAPTLPASHLEALLSSRADVAVGPSQDGGYYAIACRRIHPEMFRAVRWSEPQVLEETLRATRACELTVEVGPEWFDVDSPADLDRLAGCSGLPRHTATWLRKSGQ